MEVLHTEKNLYLILFISHLLRKPDRMEWPKFCQKISIRKESFYFSNVLGCTYFVFCMNFKKKNTIRNQNMFNKKRTYDLIWLRPLHPIHTCINYEILKSLKKIQVIISLFIITLSSKDWEKLFIPIKKRSCQLPSKKNCSITKTSFRTKSKNHFMSGPFAFVFNSNFGNNYLHSILKLFLNFWVSDFIIIIIFKSA